jgi:tight adherence protein C
MTRPWTLIFLSAISIAMVAISLALLRQIEMQDKQRARLLAMQRSAGFDLPAEDEPRPGPSLVQMVATIGRSLARSGLLPAATIAELQQTLTTAGFRQSNALSLFVGAKVLLPVLLVALAFVAVQQLGITSLPRIMILAGFAVAGLLGPDFLLRRWRAAHLKALERGLPDALDMLVICAEAGLALEAGIDRVAAEIAMAHPAVAAELQITSTELRILADRRVALTNMGTRTGLSVLQRLGSTLIQTMQYGTPLGQVLRALATEMRYELQMRFEAQASRLPVLLTLPMILFILPTIFIVVGGPAALSVQKSFIHN